MKKLHNKAWLIATVSMGILALITLLCHQPYLLRVEGQSLFLPTSTFYRYCMELPGGILTWVATFLTQFFHYPWAGALIYALLCSFVTWLTAKAFALRGWRALAAILPAAMALLSFLSLGYLIYSLKSPGFAYTPLLGFGIIAAIYWGYRSIPCAWGRLVILPLVIVTMYSAFGAYCLFASLLCLIFETKNLKKSPQTSVICLIIGAIALVVWPYVWFNLIGGRLQHTDLYTVILPWLHGDEYSQWVLFVISAIFMIIAAITPEKVPTDSRKDMLTSGAIGILAMISAVVFSCNDTNFTNTVKMQAAVDGQQWQQVLDIASASKVEPTRLNSMLTEIALMNLGQAPSLMYAYPYGGADYNTSRNERAVFDAGASTICYQWGQVNLAYRWATEMRVEYGNKVDYLKMLAKCALLNGDYAVARKYLTTLSQTMFHKDWANRYLAYIGNPSLIDQDPEMSRIRQLMATADRLEVDDGNFELFLRPTIATTTPENAATAEFAMQCALVEKDLNTFVHWLPQYMQTRQQLPRHFQEAVLLWCYINDSDAYKAANIDQNVVNQFGQFINAYQQCERLSSEQQAEYTRAAFGNTYWFYFIILDDLKFL